MDSFKVFKPDSTVQFICVFLFVKCEGEGREVERRGEETIGRLWRKF